MNKLLLTTILISLSMMCFGQEPQSLAVSSYLFISNGNWNDGTHWSTGEVPTEGSDVIIMADAVIPAGYTAIANQVNIQGGSITVADGGQLKHNTQGLVVTMEKSITAFNEVNSWSNYYLLAFPFSEDVAVPATMTAAEDNDFYTFDPDYPNAEWRNNKQHVITTVGGTTGYLYANPEDIELSLTGSTYQSYGEAAVTVEVPYTEGSSNIFNGWALLGNPFTCNAYVYALENGSCVPKEFMVYNADGELVRCFCSSIAPMQGFFVKVEETTTICIKTTAPYVDLGLPSGTLWAACNVGAVTPEDYGDYFAWGETQPKDTYNWNTYQYYDGSSVTKYTSNDGLTTLLPEDDAATVNWGSDWRMPTNEEWQELYNNTTHVWTMQDGVNGRLFTAENGNSLFLPAGGIYSNGSLGSFGSSGYYWSSSLSLDSPNLSWQSTVYLNSYNIYEFARFFGISIRPVHSTSFIINATANPAEGGEVSGGGNYQQGDECTLTATANDGYFFSNWTENDEVVSTDVTYTFTVNADRTLAANFTANGGSIGGHDYINLGLPSGTLWATCNVGADSPEAYGDYFAWGETQAKTTYSWSTYRYCNGGDGWNTLTKYCNDSNYGYNGFTDTLTILRPGDDVAKANWGGNWRMPTKEEWQELYNNTTVTWTTQDGMNGRLFTASNGNSLFLPAAGYRSNSSFYYAGSEGFYWSSLLLASLTYDALNLHFGSGSCSTSGSFRCSGLPVRAVCTSSQNATYIINATSSSTAGGTVSGAGAYNYGSTCTLSATANSGYTFTNWVENGNVVSTNATYSFTVNADRTLVANFSINVPGAINGLFTINSNGDQVVFSQGNLQYKASSNTWRFATNQYDYIGSANGNISHYYLNWIDLFGWGTSGWNNGNTYYHPWDSSWGDSETLYGPPGSYSLTGTYANSDWGVYNPISNGGNISNQWRTLKKSEWYYVFNTRSTASGIRYAKARINGVAGIVLLPDNWSLSVYSFSNTNNPYSSYGSNTLTVSQWNILEQAGAVFLPAAGYRVGTSVEQVGSYGQYWSSTCWNNGGAQCVEFFDGYISIDGGISRCYGYSVRLVHDVE